MATVKGPRTPSATGSVVPMATPTFDRELMIPAYPGDESEGLERWGIVETHAKTPGEMPSEFRFIRMGSQQQRSTQTGSRDQTPQPLANHNQTDNHQQPQTFRNFGKAELGKAKSYGQRPPTAPTMDYTQGRDTAISALRWWPHTGAYGSTGRPGGEETTTQEEAGQGTKDAMMTGSTAANARRKPGKEKKRKGSKTPVEQEKDPHMAELMAHMFLYEKVKAKEIEEAAAERAARKAAGEDIDKKVDYKDVKHNKTSQLRAIYWSDKTNPNNGEMWKMNKFTKVTKQVDSRQRAQDTEPTRVQTPLSVELGCS